MRIIDRPGGFTLSIVASLVLLVVTCFGFTVTTFNKLVRLDEAAKARWERVEASYQRRADRGPSVVGTEHGAAAFEREVTLARMRYDEVALEYQMIRAGFPTSIVARIFPSRFAEMPYLTARSDAP